MRAFRDVSIKRKLTLIIMLTTSIALLLACIAFVTYDRITFKRAMRRDLSTIAEIIGNNSASALLFSDQEAAEETLAALNAEPHIVSCYIYEADGKVFAKYLRNDTKEETLSPKGEGVGYSFADNHLLLSQPIVLDGDLIGTVYIQSDMQELYSRQRRYIVIVAIIMLASSFVALLLSHGLRRVISEPILHLAQMMRVVSTNRNYSVRAAKHGEDEVGLLIDGFNEMLTQIQGRDKALRESEEMYRSIFETNGTAAIMIEEDTIVSLANTKFEKLSGYSRKEIEGKRSWAEFVVKDDLERMKEYHNLRRMDPNSAPTNYESKFIHRSGSIRDCLATVTMIPGTRKSVAFIVDITQQKEEAERIQAAKMGSLRELIAGVAHRINNPIGVISSNSDVSSRAISKIKKIMPQNYSQEMKEEEELVKAFAALERMNQLNQIASAEIAKIVANLRRFIKLDEAKWQFADLREGIDNVIALMEPEFSGQISFIKEYGDIPSIYCSPSSLNQVFMSLFRNAFEATEGRGEIYLCASMQSKHVKIEVRDTGNGIPAEDIDRIFDPGFTTKGGRVGVGFGLSICYRIVVDEHKGSIDVSSEPGKGTTFTITLPQYYDGGLRDVTEL